VQGVGREGILPVVLGLGRFEAPGFDHLWDDADLIDDEVHSTFPVPEGFPMGGAGFLDA
jgi:hypothetical protein